jgi:hypothetical protein
MRLKRNFDREFNQSLSTGKFLFEHIINWKHYIQSSVFKFNVHGSKHRKNIPMYIQQMQDYTVFVSGNCSRCLWYTHTLSGAQATVSTASGICHNVTAICRYLPPTAHSNLFQLFHDSGR